MPTLADASISDAGLGTAISAGFRKFDTGICAHSDVRREKGGIQPEVSLPRRLPGYAQLSVKRHFRAGISMVQPFCFWASNHSIDPG